MKRRAEAIAVEQMGGDVSVPKVTLDELRGAQLRRVQDTLRRVYERVPHYRRKFDAAGVRPEDLRSLEDLQKFPFTTKEDLRQTYPFGLFAAPREDIVRLHVSSGTTGKPTVVGYTREDIETWARLMARSLRGVDLGPGEKVHIAFGYGLFTGGLGWHYGAEFLGLTVIPAGGGNTERQVQLIRDFAPDALLATPSYMLVIADEFERQGFDPSESGLRLGIFGAEPSSEALRSDIEERFGIKAYDSYGLSEVIGPGVAQELPETKGTLTLWEDHFWPEIVDPETGAALSAGEAGELVLTTLTKEGMPVIRYRTRDLTRIMPAIAHGLRRIARIRGRSDDMLIIRGVNLFPSQVEEILAQEERLAPHYLLEVRRPDRLDELTVLVEARPQKSELAEAECEKLARLAEQRVKSYAGITATVRVVAPGSLQRFEGKAKRVRDLRPKE
jgi:phenylacetate-CoA ligase